MLPDHGALNGAADFLGEGGGVRVWLHFGYHDQSLGSVPINGKGGAAAGADGCMAFFDGFFNVLGVVVAPVEDDQVFDAAMNSSPAWTKPRSPVRMKGPSFVPAIVAANISCDCWGRCQ